MFFSRYNITSVYKLKNKMYILAKNILQLQQETLNAQSLDLGGSWAFVGYCRLVA